MKKVFSIIIALAMLAGLCAFAESDLPEESVFNGVELMAADIMLCDLDGDGDDEELTWTIAEDLEDYTELVEVIINGSVVWQEYLYSAQLYVADIDVDGVSEVLVTGDMMSCDYATYCMHYTGAGVELLTFADAGRGENTDEYYDWGYGLIEAINEGTIVLNGSQDVLGTYFGSRVFALQEGVFEIADDGLWRFAWDFEDPEVWEYVSLKAVQDIPAAFFNDEGEYEGAVLAGERLLVTASDKVSIVYFTMEDGRAGYFNIEPDLINWGSLVNGVPESELFEMIPYAD